MGKGTQYFPWVHIDDVCRMVLFAIKNNDVKGIVNGVAPEVIYLLCSIFNIVLCLILLYSRSLHITILPRVLLKSLVIVLC